MAERARTDERNTACYDQNAEYRVRYNPRSFASADELGIFLESSNLHGCIHEEAARIYGRKRYMILTLPLRLRCFITSMD